LTTTGETTPGDGDGRMKTTRAQGKLSAQETYTCDRNSVRDQSTMIKAEHGPIENKDGNNYTQ